MNYLLAQSATPLPATTAQPGGQPVQPTDLKLLDWNGWGFEVRIGLVWFLVAVFVVIAVWWLLPWIRRKWLKGYRTNAVKLTFKGVEWEVCPDMETRRIAHQAWVEIKTRKVGMPFEEGLDVITEVYDSWYELFGVLRDLAKSVPADRLQECEDTRKVVALLMRALNEGLRPHLTIWQAKFRRWYQAELTWDENKSLSPQEIQARYPKYVELVADLRKASEEFVRFADSLENIVKDKE